MIMTIYGITNSPKKCLAVEGMLSYRSLTHTMFRLILHRNTLLLSLSKMPKKWYRRLIVNIIGHLAWLVHIVHW